MAAVTITTATTTINGRHAQHRLAGDARQIRALAADQVPFDRRDAQPRSTRTVRDSQADRARPITTTSYAVPGADSLMTLSPSLCGLPGATGVRSRGPSAPRDGLRVSPRLNGPTSSDRVNSPAAAAAARIADPDDAAARSPGRSCHSGPGTRHESRGGKRHGGFRNGLALRRGLPVLRSRTVLSRLAGGRCRGAADSEREGGLCAVSGSRRVPGLRAEHRPGPRRVGRDERAGAAPSEET